MNRQPKLPTTAEFFDAFKVMTAVAEREKNPERAKLYWRAANQLWYAACSREAGKLDEAAKYHRWATNNSHKASRLPEVEP